MDERIRKIFEKACLVRAFEESVFQMVEKKAIKLPVYLAAGQEYIAASLSALLDEHKINERQIFIQHRGHSTYLCFGGDLEALIYELLGDPCGCANGMGGSASIQSKGATIYGHDGLMGSQGPISVGACFGNRKFTLCFVGDAAAEEDYFLAALGWAVTKGLPIWFIVEDNNLSILTEKKVRRSWEIADVARGFGMTAFDFEDDPNNFFQNLTAEHFTKPLLLNVRTNRLFWHSGAGIDSHDIPDRHRSFINSFGEHAQEAARDKVKRAWDKCLKA